jgi:hypothetical protein
MRVGEKAAPSRRFEPADQTTGDPAAYDARGHPFARRDATPDHSGDLPMRRLALGLSLCLALSGTAARAVEEPAFKTLVQDRNFELRDYPSLVVAEVVTTGDQKAAANRGFRLLAGYIFGGNKRRASIAMTAPVAQQSAGESIPMTAPVTQTGAGQTWLIQFTMPSAYSLATLPEPNDPRVRLRATPPARFAVIRFSGLAEPGDVAAKTGDLRAWIARRQLRATGPASLAQYNPPWTPWFARRNEVMIPVAP